MSDFEIDCLDHVGLSCADVDRSVRWYEDVLGLKAHRAKEWGEFPVFMLAGRTGVALLPANRKAPPIDTDANPVRPNHFAFMVSREGFRRAVEHFEALGLEAELKDHHHFESVYVHDPDGHRVELTTLVSRPADFYRD